VTPLDRDQLRQDIRDANYAARRTAPSALVWLGAALAVLGLLAGVVWGVKVLSSDIKGAGDQVRITNDGRNRTNAQEWFAGQYEQIRSTDRRIGVAWTELQAKPGDQFATTNYRGLVNRCMEMVGAYNAEATKVSRGRWRDPALPFQIDDTDPATNCLQEQK
jgi:hypothetical protein